MKEMRKSRRRISTAEAYDVFDKAPYVTVSMVRPDGTPYGLPLSVVRSDDRTFYFHCAAEGEKIDCLAANPRVSMSAVSKCHPAFEEDKCNFTEHYKSAVAIGTARIVDSDTEKTEALRLICQRFLPRHMEHFDRAIERSLRHTAVVRITLAEPPVGKAKS